MCSIVNLESNDQFITNTSSTLLIIFPDRLGNIALKEKSAQRYGLKSEISVSCSSCDEEAYLVTSGNVAERGTSYDVNRRAVYHSIEMGSGYEGLASFCSIMNMPCISKPAYQQQMESILLSLEEEANEEMNNAGKELHELMISNETGDGGVVDVAVSFDGTWAKRGFTSLTGVVFVISVDTGKVLDYHCLSKACQKCSLKKSKCKDDAQFREWQPQHLASGECDINFDGSSPAMECEGAVTLWERSIEKHNLRYKWMVSDGDSKAYTAVKDVYGAECEVEKLDCIGHVQKRMGKHLLKLKALNKSKLSDGKSIGGKGRLTEGKIKQLQKYYGLAIRQNTSTKPNPTQAEIDVAAYTMKKNIIAILHHSVHLKDTSKQHRYCPQGESSWCKWQQDQASGTSTYDGSSCLPEVFLQELTPTFLALSDTKLLERCVRGTTQNPNECLNSLVWARCPKHKHHGIKVVRCAVASAVCHFHSGAASRENIMRRLSTPAGHHTRQASFVRDKKRLRKSDRQVTKKGKKRRQGQALLRTRREEALREAEGVTYEAGGF